MLRRLAERHGLLPDHMKITEKINVPDEVVTSGGFGNIRLGTYNGGAVAVKAMRVAGRDNVQKIRKVSIYVGRLECGLKLSRPSDSTGRSSSGKVYRIQMS